MKYHKVYIGVLNSKNIEKIEQIPSIARTHVVLLSNLNFFDLTKKQLDSIRNKNITIIPTKDLLKNANKYKKSPTYALFVDWLLKQPTEARFLLDNDSLLYIAHRDHKWHDEYDGDQGYAVSCHSGGDTTCFHGHSVSITDGSDKLILKEFDGFFLKNTQ